MTGTNGHSQTATGKTDPRTLAAEVSVLRRLAESLGGGFDIEKLSKTVVDIVVEELGALNCSLYLLDAAQGKLVLVAARGKSDAAATYYSDGGGYTAFALGDGICGMAAREGRAILVDDVTADERFVPTTPLAGEIRSLLSVPLVAGEDVVGVVNMSHSDLGAFSKENEDLLSLISAQAGIALANVLLFMRLAEANERLAFSEERLRELFSRANDALLIIDETGHIVEANRSWEEFVGVPPEAWDDVEVEPPLGSKLSLKDFLRTRTFVREGVRLEAVLLRPEGPSSIVEISSKAFPVRANEMCLVSLRDVTEKKRLAEQLIKSEKLAAIGEVTAALAHEVNNPLGALYNAVCLLKSDLDLSGDNARLIQLAVEEAAHLSEIVNDFLSFARFPHARFDWYDINELASAALFLMKRDERMGPQIEIATEMAKDLSACWIDRGQFQEVLFNLISNALDAMPDGGTLTIRTYNAKLGEKPAVGLLVADTGVGIEKNNLDKVFAPFFTTKKIGTGLGLPIVKRIVEEHWGQVAVDSAPGKGCRVSIVIPISREEALWRQS